MSTKQFTYPPTFRLVKMQMKIMIVVIPILLIALLLSQYHLSQEGFRIAVLTIVFGILVCVYVVGSLCEIKADIDGLYIEFFWKYLFIPWEKLKRIKYIGFRPVGYWVISVEDSLTLLHRLYAVGTYPLLPSFHIHEKLASKNELLSMIRSKISQNLKNNK